MKKYIYFIGKRKDDGEKKWQLITAPDNYNLITLFKDYETVNYVEKRKDAIRIIMEEQ